MNYIKTYIVKKDNLKNIDIDLPSIYKSYKQETKLGYYLLSYGYFEIFKKHIDLKKISKDSNGKPFLMDKEIFFNISHSKNFVGCSISNLEIGLDIEEDRPIKEKSLHKILNFADKDINPLKVWNIKEAYSKYLGLGLRLNFLNISVKEIYEKCNVIYIQKDDIHLSICTKKARDIEHKMKHIDLKTL